MEAVDVVVAWLLEALVHKSNSRSGVTLSPPPSPRLPSMDKMAHFWVDFLALWQLLSVCHRLIGTPSPPIGMGIGGLNLQ